MGIPKKSQGNSRSETAAPIFPQAKSVKDLVAWLEIGDSLRTINPHSCHTHLLWSTIQPQTNVRYPLLMRNYHCDLIFSQLKYFLCFGVFYINWGKNSYKIGQRGYSDLNPHWLWSPRTCTNLLLEGMYGPFLLFQFPVAYSHTDLGVTRSGWDRLIPSTSTEYELIISPQFSRNPPSLLPSRSSEPWTDSPIHPDMSNHPQLPPSHPLTLPPQGGTARSGQWQGCRWDTLPVNLPANHKDWEQNLLWMEWLMRLGFGLLLPTTEKCYTANRRYCISMRKVWKAIENKLYHIT